METSPTDHGLDAATATSYWQRNARVALTTALGIATLIASCAVPVIGESYLPEALAMALFFLMVAAGVMLISLPRRARRHQHRHKRVLVAASTQALAEREFQAYHRAYTTGLVFGICLCVVAPAAAALDDRVGPAVFMLAVAIGVFFIVYVNLVASGYKRLMRQYAQLR